MSSSHCSGFLELIFPRADGKLFRSVREGREMLWRTGRKLRGCAVAAGAGRNKFAIEPKKPPPRTLPGPGVLSPSRFKRPRVRDLTEPYAPISGWVTRAITEKLFSLKTRSGL